MMDGSKRSQSPTPAPSKSSTTGEDVSPSTTRSSRLLPSGASSEVSPAGPSSSTLSPQRSALQREGILKQKQVTIASPEGRRTSPGPSGTISSTGRPMSPDRNRPTRPTAGRRLSSSAQPHRGQSFSVDDNEYEVEEDQFMRFRTTSYSAPKRLSTLRRRTTTTGGLVPEPVAEEEPELSDMQDSQSLVDESAVEATDIEDYEPSDADSEESFTLKDRQEAINVTHPFGIKIWKPSLYKKDRSVQKVAEGDIHSAPGERVGKLLFFGNILWVMCCGWWLSLLSAFAGIICYLTFFSRSSRDYGRVFFGLAWYILYPFGRFVQLLQDESYLEEDEGEGRSISEYEQWQAGDIEEGRTFFGPRAEGIVGRRRESLDGISETDSLLGTQERTGLLSGDQNGENGFRSKRRLFGRGEWTFGRVLFFVLFYGCVGPFLLFTCGLCWFFVFTIPMARVTSMLLSHLRRHPLALTFHNNKTWVRQHGTSSSVLVCTYRAIGWKYYKYTIDGTNIFFINLMGVVIFSILDQWVLLGVFGWESVLTAPATLFFLALFSIIPLAYFIGQAVASVSAQSSMGMASALNAFFATIVEVFLYCVALQEGKARLVEGSLVGSLLAGILLMPGLSMCAGATKRKTQRFNFTSAQATITLLLFAVVAAFAPTLFYQIYGTYELNCRGCDIKEQALADEDCRRCNFSQVPSIDDKFYQNAVQPFCYIASVFLVISYIIGCMFTLKTHSSVIWQPLPPPQGAAPAGAHIGGIPPNFSSTAAHSTSTSYSILPSAIPVGEGAPVRTPEQTRTSGSLTSVKDSALYKRILGQSLSAAGVRINTGQDNFQGQTPHIVPARSLDSEGDSNIHPTVEISSLTREENMNLAVGVAELAAAAATAAVQDVQRHGMESRKPSLVRAMTTAAGGNAAAPGQHEHADHAGGHDAPNWSRLKSTVILCGATLLYAAVAEILVNKVDVVLENVKIDEKFLGITLFALVPNSTEFLNAILFAMHGNVALSMEIGSAYALQVCLLQIPCLVLFTVLTKDGYAEGIDQVNHMFTLIFPQWDLVTVILCVLLLSNIVHEGKSNYFKGSILILTYLTILIGFYYSGFTDDSPLEFQSRGMYKTGRNSGFIVGNKLGHAGEIQRMY